MAQCLTPITVKNPKTGQYQTVSCSKCPMCYKRRVSSWAFRLLEENKVSDSAHFVTLTYDNPSLHNEVRWSKRRGKWSLVKIRRITANNFLTLCKQDVQDFIKRLRFSQNESSLPIKYYAAGEYGGKTNRPHYHIILLNAMAENIPLAWQNGHVHIAPINIATINYTLKYICKSSKVPLHNRDDRQPEFALMSKHLGVSYLTPEIRKYHRVFKYEIYDNFKIVRVIDPLKSRLFVNLDGYKVALPRYYKEKIFPKVEREYMAPFLIKKSDENFLRAVSRGTALTGHRLIEAVKAAFEKFRIDERARSKI